MKKFFFIFFFIGLSIIFLRCTTEKNTAITRAYHNLTAHYNVYFNGEQALIEAEKKIDKQQPDNFQSLLPIFKYSYPEVKNLVGSDMNRVLEKGAKTISNHSITVKPKLKNRKNLTPRDKELLKKNEYCKWIDDAYLIIGKANFYKGDYAKSLLTFRRILNNYKTENTRFEAQLWLGKTYIAQKKFKDAENSLIDLMKDPRHPKKLDVDIYLTLADLYIQTQKYTTAVDYLKKAIVLIKGKRKKARYYYIMAQLYYLLGDYTNSDLYYKKVIRSNASYQMVFNAKIARASAFTSSQDAQQIIKQLKKLLKDEKNEEYRDQIYYAIAQVYLKEGDTAMAVKNLKLSTLNSTSNNTQKAISFLALADIFFNKRDFLKAGEYYDSTMQYLPQNYPSYQKISKRARNTGLLVKYLGEVKLQDSLQRVAKMPEQERNKLILKLVQQAIEEQKKLQQTDNFYYDPLDAMNQQNNPTSQGGKWYFYNPMLVSRGQAEFKKKWGNRKLEDNWRRKNKSVVSETDEQDTLSNENKNLITDKTKPEYYLQNLPLNDSLMKISNNKIKEALFNAADVYQNLFNDKKNAIKLYEKLLMRFPNSDYTLETYYRLYKLYSSIDNNQEAEKYRKKIIVEYPKSKYAKILLDPLYSIKIQSITQTLMNLYDKTLIEYNNKKYQQVIVVSDSILNKYPESDVYPYFMYLKAMSLGQVGNIDTMKVLLTNIVENYKTSQVSTLAKATLEVINSGKYDYSIYDYKPNSQHAFISVYNDNANNTLLQFQVYAMAQDFSDKKVFEVKIKKFDDKRRILTVRWFTDANEAKIFMNKILNSKIYSQANIVNHQDFIISQKNLEILLKDKNIVKYKLFYDRYYSN